MSSPTLFAGNRPITPRALIHGLGVLLGDDAGEHHLGVGLQLAGGLADDLVVEDLRVTAGQIPGLEEGAPVDEIHQLGEVDVEGVDAQLGRAWPACRPGRGSSGRHWPGRLPACTIGTPFLPACWMRIFS